MSELVDFTDSSIRTIYFNTDFNYFEKIEIETIEGWKKEFYSYAKSLTKIGGKPTLAYENYKKKKLILHIEFNPPYKSKESDYWIGAKASELATAATILEMKADSYLNYFLNLTSDTEIASFRQIYESK